MGGMGDGYGGIGGGGVGVVELVWYKISLVSSIRTMYRIVKGTHMQVITT